MGEHGCRGGLPWRQVRAAVFSHSAKRPPPVALGRPIFFEIFRMTNVSTHTAFQIFFLGFSLRHRFAEAKRLFFNSMFRFFSSFRAFRSGGPGGTANLFLR